MGGGFPEGLPSNGEEVGRDGLWGTVEQETNPTGIWTCQELSPQQLDILVQEATQKSHGT